MTSEPLELVEDVQAPAPSEGSTDAQASTSSDSLILEQVRDVVNSGREAEDAAIDGLAQQVRELGDSVRLLNAKSAESGSGDTGMVYTVRIDPVQADTAKGAVRLACTEGLVCIALLSAILGVQLFALFRKGWPNG